MPVILPKEVTNTTINLGYSYEKLRTSMRYWLLGRNYIRAAKAMEFGLQAHTGKRKDGTPEFSHQIFQAQFARTLEPWLIDPEGTMITVFLHDVVEDVPGITHQHILDQFGSDIAQSVEVMTNRFPDGTKKPLDSYYRTIGEDVRASIAKGIDRVHNHQSMGQVFSDEKKIAYLNETEHHILPLMKMARRRYPEQEPAYQNIKHILLTQMELIRYSLL